MSDTTLYRLNESTVAEPLVNMWGAWSHLISPAPLSLHIKNYQLKVLESYLEDPNSHVEICKQPSMRSGPFVDIPEHRASEVAELLAQMKTRQKNNIEFAQTLIAFHNFLVEDASGQSLDPYYEKLPSALKGHVELVYDYYNRPTVRCLESLLYESRYYSKELQTLRLFTHKSDASRPFIMSTPRLLEAGQIDWRVSFDNERIDDFCKLDTAHQPLGYIRELLGLRREHDDKLIPLLSRSQFSKRKKWEGTGVRAQYIGHACVLIEWEGKTILTDPFIGASPIQGGINRVRYDELPERIDFALITHNHHDHFCLESLIRLRHKIDCLVVPRSFGMSYGDLSLKLLAKRVGFKNVIELDALESIPLPDGGIFAVPFLGEHADLPHGKSAYVVRTGSQQMLFAADSDCLDKQMYKHIRRILGPIETVFIGLECVGAPLSWSCGTFLPRKPEHGIEQSRRYKGCDSERALSLLEAVGAKRLFIYAMGLEPWLEYLLGLALTEDSAQIQEAKTLLRYAQEKGFEEAKLLSGKCDIKIPTHSRKRQATVKHSAPVAVKQEPECVEDHAQYFPLSFAQQRILAEQAFDNSGSVDNIAVSISLKGRVQIAVLIQAINKIIERHDILRASFSEIGGKLMQTITSIKPVVISIEDLEQTPASEKEERMRRLMNAEMRKPFDQETGLLLRTVLLRLDMRHHILLVVISQLVADDYSLRIFAHELVQLYESLSENKPCSLPAKVLRYSDFVSWQTEAIGAGFAFWKGLGPGSVDTLDLPCVRQTTGSRYLKATQPFHLDFKLMKSVRLLSKRHGVPLFATLLAAFQCLLFRWTAQEDILVATLLPTRKPSEWADSIGFFSEIIPLRTSLSGDPTFKELLDRVCKAMLPLKKLQPMPLQLLLDQLYPGAGINYRHALKAGFVLQEGCKENFTLSDLRMKCEVISRNCIKTDICLSVYDSEPTTEAQLYFDSSRVQPEAMVIMAEQLKALLNAVVNNPDVKLLDIAFDHNTVGKRAKAAAQLSDSESEDNFEFGDINS